MWFPPVDWHEVGVGIRESVQEGIGWFFDLFTMNAKADALSVDSTTVTVVDPAAGTCTTSQTAAAGDNAVLVMLSNRGPTAYTSVTYGSASLSLIPGTATSGTGIVRTEMWFYQGVIPGGTQTMTATLVSGTAKQVCATVLLGGVWATTPTAGGTTASGTTANPSISISPASAGELAFAVLGIRGTTAPTAVTGTGATATSLYGIAPTQCAAAPNSFCGAGADMPFPGTAITWTDGNATDWVISAVRVLPTPNCGVASGNCYRIGAGGTWATGANWSNTSGGATCSCTPVATNDVIFNATPTGTTTLAAATTIASIDMTGFTGTLDTTASNWALTVNGPFAIQGTFQARSSTIAVTGDVDVLTAGTIVSLGLRKFDGEWVRLCGQRQCERQRRERLRRDGFVNLDRHGDLDKRIDVRLMDSGDRHGHLHERDRRDDDIRRDESSGQRVQQPFVHLLGGVRPDLHHGDKGPDLGRDAHDLGRFFDDRARNGQSRPDRRRTQRRQWRDPYRQRFHSHRVERGDDRGNERNDHAHYQLVHEHRQLGHEWRRLRVHEGHEHGDDERCGQHRDSECEQQLQQPGHLGGGSGHPNRPRGRLRNLDGECRLNPGEQHLHADRGHPRSEHGGWDKRGRSRHE